MLVTKSLATRRTEESKKLSEQLAKTKNLKVAIIGGGIGGAATALALQKKGIQAHVYEQAQALGEVGAAIIITSPTQDFLYEWGVGDLLEKYGESIETIDMYTAQGDFISSSTYEQYAGDVKGVNEVRPQRLVPRPRILEMLLSTISEEYIHLDHKCESIHEYDEYVEIRFTNGEVVQADVVIAADGIHSKTRPLFSNDEPIFAGGHAIRIMLEPGEGKDLFDGKALRVYQDGQSSILVAHVKDRIAIDMMLPSEDTSWVLDLEKEELLSYFKGYDENLVKLVSKAEFPVKSRGLYHRKPIESWSTNRITLLGDAAHAMLPTLGQGANSAIQDAGVLAIALAEFDTIAEALQRYEDERLPITAAIQNGSKDISKLTKA